jgi:hypothetical protein
MSVCVSVCACTCVSAALCESFVSSRLSVLCIASRHRYFPLHLYCTSLLYSFTHIHLTSVGTQVNSTQFNLIRNDMIRYDNRKIMSNCFILVCIKSRSADQSVCVCVLNSTFAQFLPQQCFARQPGTVYQVS